MTRCLLTTSAAVMLGSTLPTFGATSAPFCGANAATPTRASAYVAVRRLEARTERSGRYGWMEVRTTYTGDRRFTYEVLQEGGSEQIRRKALLPALARERELVEKGTAVHMPALLANYDCAAPQPDHSGFVRVAIRPREPSRHLVNGTLLWEPQTGAVVRVAGRLAKSPSFWVSDVETDWEYGRVAGVVLPTALHARAKVRFVGPSTFDMTYRYTSVDGHPVGAAVTTAGGESR
jgi:hypothetical protein